MKLLLTLLVLISIQASAQHSFSIVAVDPATGEVGGAGATCYSTVNDIADVHPGVGFIHTQSYVNYNNQAFAKQLMDQGFSPQEIMDSLSLTAVDDENAPSYRQYAAVDLTNGGRSAAFTGNNCFTYYGERLGPTYAIAGNILLGPEVLDSMETRFNNTTGSLADKLMAALQGAKIQGADKRCLDSNVSSLSAYMIVAQPNDTPNNYCINLNVENVMPADPIDVLQTNYDDWKAAQPTGLVSPNENTKPEIYPNPTHGEDLTISDGQPYDYSIMTMQGELVKEGNQQNTIATESLSDGMYFLQLMGKDETLYGYRLLINQ